jgi:hypothetical protein
MISGTPYRAIASFDRLDANHAANSAEGASLELSADRAETRSGDLR